VLIGNATLGLPIELEHTLPGWRLAAMGLVGVGVVLAAWLWTAPSGAPRTNDRALRWLAAGGVLATLPGAAGYPSGRVLVIPDLAFAAILGLVLHWGLVARAPGRVLVAVLAVLHLGIAPVGAARSITRLARRSRDTQAIAAEIERNVSPTGVAFLVASSDPTVYLYPRSILADVAPGALRCWSTLSGARSRHRLTRTGAHTFAIEPLDRPLLDGSFDELFRSDDRPFAVGDTTEQCGAVIRVAQVSGGRPTRLDVEMRRSLDDPGLAVLVWRDRALARLVMPPVGGSIELPWSPGPTGVL
jgi:hypothetical protein